MAADSDARSTWADIAKSLIDTFLILRDVFAYALPGGLFLGIDIISGRLSLSRLDAYLSPYHPPTWALAVLLIGACYIIGHVLIAIAYLRVDFWKLFHLNDPEWLADYPTEVNARDLYLRHYFPEIFRELDRRETLAMLLYACVAALVLGWLVFFIFHPSFADVIIWTAILVFLDTLTTMSHLSRVRKAVHAAGLAIEERERIEKENERAIQPTGEQLRFVIDAIFRAAELASPKPPQPQTTVQAVPPDGNTAVPAAPASRSEHGPAVAPDV